MITQHLYDFYSDSLLLGWTFICFMGAYLFFSKLPQERRIENYMRSKKLLGVSLMLWSAQVFLQWLFNFRTTNPPMASVVNFGFYFPCSILFAYAFIALLDYNYITSRRIKSDVIKVIAFLTLIISTIFLPPKIATLLLYVLAACFAANVILLCVHFFRSYNHAKQQADNYYTEDIDVFIKWLSICIYILIIFGIVSAPLSFAPRWFTTLYMLIGIMVFIYVFASFQNYMLYYRIVDAAIVDSETLDDEKVLVNKKMTGVAVQVIDKHMQQWIADKGYVQAAINIEELARMFSTNRTYLSLYINEHYQCSFRQFISRLRVDESKRLLAAGSMRVSEISFAVGFSTASHFSRTFKQLEGVSPQEWKDA